MQRRIQRELAAREEQIRLEVEQKVRAELTQNPPSTTVLLGTNGNQDTAPVDPSFPGADPSAPPDAPPYEELPPSYTPSFPVPAFEDD